MTVSDTPPPTIGELIGHLGLYLERFEVGELSSDDAAAAAKRFGKLKRMAQSAELLCLNRAAATSKVRRRDDVDGSKWAGRQLGTTPGHAAELLNLAGGLEAAPRTLQALEAGDISAEQAAEVVRTETVAPGSEADMLDHAGRSSLTELKRRGRKVRAAAIGPEKQAERIRRTRYLRTWVDDEGAGRGAWSLPLAEHSEVVAHFESHTDQVFREARREGRHEPIDAYRADALVRFAKGALGSSPAGCTPEPSPGSVISEPAPQAENRPAESDTSPGAQLTLHDNAEPGDETTVPSGSGTGATAPPDDPAAGEPPQPSPPPPNDPPPDPRRPAGGRTTETDPKTGSERNGSPPGDSSTDHPRRPGPPPEDYSSDQGQPAPGPPARSDCPSDATPRQPTPGHPNDGRPPPPPTLSDDRAPDPRQPAAGPTTGPEPTTSVERPAPRPAESDADSTPATTPPQSESEGHPSAAGTTAAGPARAAQPRPAELVARIGHRLLVGRTAGDSVVADPDADVSSISEIAEVVGHGPVPVDDIRGWLGRGVFVAVVVTTDDDVLDVRSVLHLGRRSQLVDELWLPATGTGRPTAGPGRDTTASHVKVIVHLTERELAEPASSPLRAAVQSRGVDVATLVHRSRHPNAVQRTALQWRSPECAVLGCPNRIRLEADHVIEWHLTHHTALAELEHLCRQHHRMKTHDGYRLAPGTGKRPLLPPTDPPPDGSDP